MLVSAAINRRTLSRSIGQSIPEGEDCSCNRKSGEVIFAMWSQLGS